MSMLAQLRTIGDTTYEVMPLNASAAIRVAGRVVGIVAPALRSVASLRSAATAVGAALAGGMEQLDAEDVVFLTGEFAKVTQVCHADGRKVPLMPCFDEHFRGRFFDMLGWLRAAAEVTFGPLGDIPGKLTATQASAAAPPGE